MNDGEEYLGECTDDDLEDVKGCKDVREGFHGINI